jgi:hypothetical protein
MRILTTSQATAVQKPIEAKRFTRRTARFGRLAQHLSAACEVRGISLEPAAVDDILNSHISHLAEVEGLTTRTALRDLRLASIAPLAADVARFADLADILHDACAGRGIQVSPSAIREVLKNQIAHISHTKGISGRTALRHIHRDAIGLLADDIVTISGYLDAASESADDSPSPQAHDFISLGPAVVVSAAPEADVST